jgi:hypothetical protein
MGVAAGVLIRHNERTKFAAGVLDKLALAIAGAGYIVPVVKGTLPGEVQSAVTILWLLIGIGLWVAAYALLGRLR